MRNSFVKRFIASAASAVMAMSAAVSMATFTASADTGANQAVNADKNGIVEIEVWYRPTGDKEIMLQTGTGFLVNNTTILTCSHVIDPDADMQSFVEILYDDDFDKDYVNVEVVTLGDVTKRCTVHTDSPSYDYAILTVPENTLSTKTPLILSSANSVEQTQTVYSLGFPGTVQANKNDAARPPYTTDDVTVKTGKVSKTGYTFANGVDKGTFIQHDVNLSAGDSGGPLVDANGYVVGVNKGVVQNAGEAGYYYSFSIDTVREQLDMSNIEYQTADGDTDTVETEPTSTETQPVVTGETIETLPTQAQPVETQPAETKANDNNDDDDDDDDKDSSNTTVILIAVFGVVALILIILIIVFATKGSKKNAQPVQPAGRPGYPPQQPQQPQQPQMQQPNPYAPPQQPAPAPMPSAPTGFDTGAGETSLLNAGAGETSVLGGPAGSRAMLIRRRNGTNINIDRPEFVIGKERSRVNCCLNNNAVSRVHAKITTNGQAYFITDLGSSNFTYVNGTQIPANQPTQLSNGDVIKLADEELEFRG